MTRKPELLAPAGNREKLETAIHFGADAVYLGGKEFGLRSFADNFDLAELGEAVACAHGHGVKVYLTVNSYPAGEELPRLEEYIGSLRNIGFDAYIASDPGVIALMREIDPGREIHLSTQANTTNWRSALFWEKLGVSRVNLARETTLEGIREVRRKISAEIETFVHGAMCISYSGRCLLSSAMTGRNANRGECAHPCRWSYSLVEEKRPGEYFPVMEEGGETFIFNSRDLCLLPHLPELVAAGVDSLKIEGRMKGIHYVGSVVRVYREALDRLAEEGDEWRVRPEWMEELSRISHRGYTTGFLFGEPRDVGQEYRSRYIRTHELVGVVNEVREDGTAVIGIRNRVRSGERLQFIGRGMREGIVPEPQLLDPEGAPLAEAHPNSAVLLRLPFTVEPRDLVRREKG